LIGFVGVGPAAWALTACGGAESDSSPTTTASTLPFADRFAAFAPADEPNGDLAMVEWPDFILQAGGDIQRLYEFQVVNGEIMRYMPCFCGCHLEDGHQNNRDCYIERVNADGSVVFDSMAPT
jgi:hypothetical protein